MTTESTAERIEEEMIEENPQKPNEELEASQTEIENEEAAQKGLAAIKRELECLLLAAGEPVSLKRLAEVLRAEKDLVNDGLSELTLEYDERNSGLQVLELAGGFQLATRPEYAEVLERYFAKVRRTRLSKAALETLAIIAYKQPVTRAEVEAIRGVNVDGVFTSLLEKDMVKVVGRKEEIGRPVLYGTTEEFLNHFGMVSLTDLPALEDFMAAVSDAPDDELSPEERAYRKLLEEGEVKTELVELAQAAERELSEIERRLKHIKVSRVPKKKDPNAEDTESDSAE